MAATPCALVQRLVQQFYRADRQFGDPHRVVHQQPYGLQLDRMQLDDSDLHHHEFHGRTADLLG